MAFCTNCGKSLQEGARFCTNCGVPAQAAAAAVVETSNGSVAAATAAVPVPQPAVPASESGAVLPEGAAQPVPIAESAPSVPYGDFAAELQPSKSPMFVIVCVVLLVLIVGGIAGTVYLQRQGKAKAGAQQSAIETSQTPSSNSASAGSNPASSTSPATSAPITSEPTTSAMASAPAGSAPASAPVANSIRVMSLGSYPGATPVAIATLTGETVVAGFLTRDTPQQVIQFYKIRFPVSTTTESQGKAELAATLPGGERIRIQAQPQGASTQVMVLQEN